MLIVSPGSRLCWTANMAVAAPAGGVDLGVDALHALAGSQAREVFPAARQAMGGRLDHGIDGRAFQAAGADFGAFPRRLPAPTGPAWAHALTGRGRRL
jgi:hypothetical protein